MRLWIGLFGLWALFLSGALSSFLGSPGAIQAIHLRNLLANRRQQINSLQAELARLQGEALRLEKISAFQEREIRKVLGYAASDELIFDFTPSGQLD